MDKKRRKTHLWQFDPSIFQPGRKAGFFERHIQDRIRAMTKSVLYGVAFAYPIALVTLGIVFGGIVFWSALGVSMILLWFILKKAGYARNFEGWDIGYKKFLGLFISFGMMLAFVYGLAYSPLRVMTIPVMMGIFGLALALGVWILSHR